MLPFWIIISEGIQSHFDDFTIIDHDHDEFKLKDKEKKIAFYQRAAFVNLRLEVS